MAAEKKYRLLKDIQSIPLKAKAGEVGVIKGDKVWFDNDRYFYYLQQVESDTEWFAPVEDKKERIDLIKLKKEHTEFLEMYCNVIDGNEYFIAYSFIRHKGDFFKIGQKLYTQQQLEQAEMNAWYSARETTEHPTGRTEYENGDWSNYRPPLYSNFLEFKQSKQQARKHSSPIIKELLKEIEDEKVVNEGRDWEVVKYNHVKTGGISNLPSMHDNDPVEIHSVKRKSDSEIFTIGDDFCLPGLKEKVGQIKEFKVDGNKMQVHYSLNQWYFLEQLSKLPSPISREPLFRTEVEWEKMDEPKFPCLFVPITTTGSKEEDWKYQWEKSEIVECKIRGAGHYFKIKQLSKSKTSSQ